MRTMTTRLIPVWFAAIVVAGFLPERSWAAPFVPVRDPQVVAFAPSGKLVATGCSGMSDGSFPPRPHPDVRKCGVVSIWDVATGKRLRRMETFGDLTQLAFSPDGTLLAATRLYATTDGVTLNEVRIWDASTGRPVKTLDRCHGFDFSPDGKRLGVLSRTRCVVYDIGDWSKEHLVKPLGGAIRIAFQPSGDRLVGICREGRKFCLRACDIASGENVRESVFVDTPFYSVAQSADGDTLATGHNDGLVVLWDPTTLEPKGQLNTGVAGIAHPFFSTDGKQLAAGSQTNGDVVVWDLASKQERRRYTFDKGGFKTYYARTENEVVRPEKDPMRFAFAPEGDAFLVGAYGGILRLVEDGRDIQRFGE
jgi:WD40 repeat protein